MYNPDGEMSAKNRSSFLGNNLYSIEKVKKRKADHEQRATLMENLDKQRAIEVNL